MANWSILKAAIANVVKTNNNQEITGQTLQNVLLNIVSTLGQHATFAGIAKPTTNPGVPDGPVFYLATQAGAYANFSGLVIAEKECAFITYSTEDTTWSKEILPTGGLSDDEVAEIQSIISAIDNRVETVENSISGLSNRVETVENSISGLSNSLVETNQSLGQIGQGLSSINQQLKDKAGAYLNDVENGQVLVFASIEDRDTYIEDTSRTDLIIDTFTASGGGGGTAEGFSINIDLLSEYYMAALPSQKSLYIEFNFNVKNSQGLPTGDDVLAVFTFRWNSITKTVTQKFTAGQKARLAIDDYIGKSGITNIAIKLTGVTTGASTSFAVVCNKVDLALTDNFKVNTVCNLISNPNTSIAIPYTLSGAGLKVMEWYIDGVQQPLVKSDDEVTEQSTSRVKYIPATELPEGVHSLQFRAYTTVNGEKFYSHTAYREFAVYRGQNNEKVLIMVGADLNAGQLIAPNSNLTLNNITQYLPYTIKAGIFNPENASSTPIDVYIDSDKQTTLSMNNAAEQPYTFTITTTTVGTIKLKYGTEEKIINTEIVPSSSSLTELTAGLSLSLMALGKSNASADRNAWTYKSIATNFTGFKWNAQSGWNDNRLVIADGARIDINYAPLSGDVTETGKTLEFEFATSSVLNDDAVICDLRNGSTGLLITASEASITSATGAKASVKYKPEDNIRISFVINPKENATNKLLVFVYINGECVGAVNYSLNDNFRVTDNISFVSSNQAAIKLKELRFYDIALSADQILNNYTLYRDTVAEMLEVYDRNNIYTEGTSELSIDILSGQSPVLIVTGNWPAIEATTDKNLQIEADIEYINLQEPSLSFKIKKAAVRPQGTSSMGYPKKNARQYTNKYADTVLYDANGNAVANKLYAFILGAQPVNCWCFKADYAESSGTHNTGVARLWNDVLKNAQIDGEYKLRTEAQKAAIENNYPYDVRTTIDGFPILMFYRLTENDPLVFIGKYNFNNDKSTESVFGFKDIPGFNNAKMQCWEVLNNGHHLALFQDVTNWNTEWDKAFESRYPDVKNPDTTDLKAFATWMSSVSQTNFATQKWEHLDVYKVAAYYIYLMRFGAVDQVVKNAMFTSEDGIHWYYINYDNDTILGLRNDGLLIYPPTIDRQTLDDTFTATVYAYAGHDSRLWNMLEGDTEFMEIVRKVDAALYTAGLTYEKVIEMFDDKQSSKWCERIYNQDAQYKYIGPFNNDNINNLFMLQGSRRSHRRWWLARRFNLMDGKFVSGAYKDNVFEVKLAGAPIGLNFSIVSGFPMNYGYGVNNVPIQSGIFLNTDASHEFVTASVLNVGDPLRLYAAPNIREIDIHEFTPYLSTVNMAGVFSATLGTALEKLVLGASGNTVNNALNELSGISNATMLKHLDIRGYKAINALDLSSNVRLTTLLASNSGLASLTLADGAPVTSLELPSTMQIVELHNLPLLTTSGLNVAGDFANVTYLKITGCESLDSKSILDTWLANKTAAHASCSVELDGIDWTGIDPEWLMQFGNMLSVSFKGTVEITSINETVAEQLTAVFGINCFKTNAEFYIKLPAGSSVLAGPSTVTEEHSYQYTAIMSNIADDITYSISPAERENITLSPTGLLTIGLNPSPLSVLIKATSRDAQNNVIQVTKTVTIQPYTFPTEEDIVLSGKEVLTNNGSFTYNLQIAGEPYTGAFTVEWSLIKPDGVNATLETSERSCVLLLTNLVAGENIKVKATIKKTNGVVIAEKEFSSLMIDSSVIMTAISNPNMMAFMYAKGYAAHSTYMTLAEAEAVTDFAINSGDINDSDNTDFDEFKYFSNAVISNFVPTLKSITLPWVKYSYNGKTIKASTINLPYTIIIEVNNDFIKLGYTGFRCDTFNAPALKKIVFTGDSINSSNTMRTLVGCYDFTAPSLEEVDLSLCTTKLAINVFYIMSLSSNNHYDFPSLKRLKRITYDSYTANTLIGYYRPESRPYVYVNMPKLIEIDIFHILYCSSSYSGFYAKVYLDIESEITLGNNELVYLFESLVKIKALNANGEVSFANYNKIEAIILPKCTVYISNLNTKLEEVSCFTFGDRFALNRELTFLRTLSIYSPVAPDLSSVNSDLGSEVPSDTPKMLYLKQGATGYDADIWNTPPLSNYTKSFTL